MRCKRHTVDFSSSTNGVCASCLRERLLSLAASAAVTAAIEDNNNRNQSSGKSNHPPLLIFPRSVSPYVTRRKSDAATGTGTGEGKDEPLTTSSNRRFITTPQVDLAGYSCKDFESNRSHNKPKKSNRFSNLFRARSEDFDSNPKSNNPRFSSDASESSSSSSRSWISTMLSTGRRKKQPCYIEDVIAGRRPQRIYCRGMSPARDTTETEAESLEELRSTPATTTTKTPGRRKVGGNGIGKKSMSGMAFCLSPLVRASPNCPFKRRMRFPSEFGNSGGEVTTEQEKPHISAAASFCANRSKKLVDLGRVDRRR